MVSGLLEVFLTGGIPPYIDDPCPADNVYMATFQRVMVQNEKFYARFPQDVEIVKDIVNFLVSQPNGGVQTPRGHMLRPRTLQLLGLSGAPRCPLLDMPQHPCANATALPLHTGMAYGLHSSALMQAVNKCEPPGTLNEGRDELQCVHAALASGGPGGGFERLHFLLASAMDCSSGEPELTPSFLKEFDMWLAFDTNPLYAVMHESIYTQGPATRWAAERVREQHFAKVFDAEVCSFSKPRV
jgi:hypothetical protein